MDNIISYNTYTKKANKYLIKCYTKGGKRITYNKLRHKIIDYDNKKHKLSKQQKMYNDIQKYLNDEIDDTNLDKAMHYFIGN